ncbi:MAG: hypothetical protein A2901_04945 [Elusimicrobia bacterium RIFCSPLOWO2_01_FULL_54_10]|nr:MAG: hypothetical protein A2901_04945 [Elusimicrobia bacterium RIFCSPLOWO2_01_FULL_54_10]
MTYNSTFLRRAILWYYSIVIGTIAVLTIFFPYAFSSMDFGPSSGTLITLFVFYVLPFGFLYFFARYKSTSADLGFIVFLVCVFAIRGFYSIFAQVYRKSVIPQWEQQIQDWVNEEKKVSVEAHLEDADQDGYVDKFDFTCRLDPNSFLPDVDDGPGYASGYFIIAEVLQNGTLYQPYPVLNTRSKVMQLYLLRNAAAAQVAHELDQLDGKRIKAFHHESMRFSPAKEIKPFNFSISSENFILCNAGDRIEVVLSFRREIYRLPRFAKTAVFLSRWAWGPTRLDGYDPDIHLRAFDLAKKIISYSFIIRDVRPTRGVAITPL